MPKKTIADIRREEFAVAAFAVLSEHGMNGTTLQRVAEHTGASKASVLHYFGSKQILIETALRKANATLRREAVALMGLAESPWERFYAIIEANFSQTTFNRKVAHGWISMCAEVPHNRTFQRVQTAIYRRLNSNLHSALKDIDGDPERCAASVRLVSLLIDGIWMRCGLQIGGLERDDAVRQIEIIIDDRYGSDDVRLAARDKMRLLGRTLNARAAA
ncbi:transcriptional regulator BetI [Oricola sp.]|uniref:transcriptional regulator BetI n=1 Tax=Oricola sp. TaxID=1979950 RepID=UPI003BA8CF07